MLDKIYIYEVVDHAAFSNVLARRAFADQNTGSGWAKVEVLAARDRLKASGETDQAYIEAIEYRCWSVDYDRA